MTVAQAIRAANDQRPISYRERSEALQVLRNAALSARALGWNVLAESRWAHHTKLMESRP